MSTRHAIITAEDVTNGVRVDEGQCQAQGCFINTGRYPALRTELREQALAAEACSHVEDKHSRATKVGR